MHRSPPNMFVGSANRVRGAAAIIAMMFLVIFGSLSAAMAIVSQGNLTIADSQLKTHRALAAAETGMNLISRRLDLIAADTRTRFGIIDNARAQELWTEPGGLREQIFNAFANEPHNIQEPVYTARGVRIGPIAVGPSAPTFTVTLEPHPLPGPGGATDFSRYDGPFYQRVPYNDPDLFDGPVSSANPLDGRWLRVVVTAADGPAGRQITRAISMDFRIDKRLRFAVLSRSRVMIGRNVMIEGRVGSRFLETDLEHGHPVQMESDFYGLHPDLDEALNLLRNTLASNDIDGDNRINLASITETSGITNPQQYDVNGDGYIDDFDFFLAHFDSNGDGRVSLLELESGSTSAIRARQLMQLIDTFGNPGRPGYNDGFIDGLDRYAKIRGQVLMLASKQDWNNGAAGGTYQDFFEGSIHPDYGQPPLTFEAVDENFYEFGPQDFDVATFRNMTSSDVVTQAATQFANHDPDDPTSPNMDLSGTHREAVPYGAAHPYDYYDRPVYENMTFHNARIPLGLNALFRNCRFVGVTFIETMVDNADPNFNYAGAQNADGTLKYPSRIAIVNEQPVSDTKTVSNNVRFDNCTFEGAVVSDAPSHFTHVRNKASFTGTTRFKIDDSTVLTAEEKALFKRSTVLMPHYSVEMGTFIAPSDLDETLELSGTIVAGVVDMRGQIKLDGSIVTTFEPQSGVEPVIGATSPHFNTTLGYFSSADGDYESELPADGVGVIQIRYDPTLAMPDGILGPIEMAPVIPTYFEGVAP